MFRQREFRPSDTDLEAWRLWQPRPGREYTTDAVYLVVDELDDEVVVLVASRWPRTDQFGRLRFDEDRLTFWVDHDRLQRIVDYDREAGSDRPPATTPRTLGNDAEAQEALGRPLRVGDVFAARHRTPHPADTGLDAVSASLQTDPMASAHRAVSLDDVSAEARAAAKTALYGAAAPAVDDAYARRVGLIPADAPVADADEEG